MFVINDRQSLLKGSSNKVKWINQRLKVYNVGQDFMTLVWVNMRDMSNSHHLIRKSLNNKVVTESQLRRIFSKTWDTIPFEKSNGDLGIYTCETL